MWALKEGEVKTVKKDLKHSTTCLTSTPTGLTPNPSPRGEGSEMPCLLYACYGLTRKLVNS